MMRFIIAGPDEATLSRRNPQFRISIFGSAFDDLRYQRISEATCDIRHLSFLRFCADPAVDQIGRQHIGSQSRGCGHRLANDSGREGKPGVVLFQKSKSEFETIWRYGESSYPPTKSD